MQDQHPVLRSALATGLILACVGAQADRDVAVLQQRLDRMQREMMSLRAELAQLSAQAPAPAPSDRSPDNRVFFCGGYTKLTDAARSPT